MEHARHLPFLHRVSRRQSEQPSGSTVAVPQVAVQFLTADAELLSVQACAANFEGLTAFPDGVHDAVGREGLRLGRLR